MRFFLLSLSLFLIYIPSSLGFTTDVYYIETVITDNFLFLDYHEIDRFAEVVTKNINLASNVGIPPTNGSQAYIAAIKKLFPATLVLQNAITTQRIAFVGPTDENYAFTKAKVLTYVTTTLFGSGNLAGQIFTSYVEIDDVLVKTSLPGYGGWRVSDRFIKAIVSLFSLNLSPYLMSCSKLLPRKHFFFFFL